MSRTPFCIKYIFVVLFLCTSTFRINSTVSKKVLINEFLSLNSEGLKDEDGDNPDWIELYNPGETAVDLSGWFLTDDENDLHKWSFPSVSIGAGEYMVIFASGKDRKSEKSKLHTSFKLSGGGEYLALVEADSDVVSYEYAPYFPAQQTDMSYGIYMNQHTYFKTPTPGAGNSLGTQVMSPEFSKPRGFYDAPFEVSLSVPDQNAVIYYTTDGTRPDATKGIRYASPIKITTTTPLSAVAIIDGISSPVISNTYLFIKDIVNQPSNPRGYPGGWGKLHYKLGNYDAGKRAPADYAMDPDITKSTEYKDLMDDALKSIPTLSIVTNPGYLFSYSIDPDTGGIYIYTGDVVKTDSLYTNNTKMGADWERPSSVEYFNTPDNDGFQINCGLRIHGGNGRKAYNTPKHSFRLSFRSEYGMSKLNYDLFEEKKAAKRFDHLVVRAPMNFSWLHNNVEQRTKAQYVHDRFSKNLQLNMGQISSHEKFMHVYINGLYWGVYSFAEKINNDFIAEYTVGDDEQFDVVNDDWSALNAAVDGNLTAFKSMKSYAGSSNYEKLVSDKLLDCVNYIDYMLMNYYIGNQDWDGNNWFAARNRVTPENGFRYFSWDAETCLKDVNYNLVSIVDKELTKMFADLSKNADFKLLVADRIQKHLFNGGALTKEKTSELYDLLSSVIDTAMIAESARWGDYRRDFALDGNITYTYNNHWAPRKEYLMSTYFTQRTDIVYNQFKSAGYIPVTKAPAYNSSGGELKEPFDLTISANTGTIYYTTDGNDPRTSITSAISPFAKVYGSPLHVVGSGTVKARAKNGAEWSPLAEVSFIGKDSTNFVTANPNVNLYDSKVISDVYCVNSNIFYTLPDNGYVRIDIYSTDGRLVSTIQNGYLNAGQNKSEFMAGGVNRLFIFRINYNGQIVSGKLFCK